LKTLSAFGSATIVAFRFIASLPSPQFPVRPPLENRQKSRQAVHTTHALRETRGAGLVLYIENHRPKAAEHTNLP